MPPFERDAAAYAAFLLSLRRTAEAQFRVECPDADQTTLNRFSRFMGHRIKEQFPEYRFEAFIRNEPRQENDAKTLIAGYVSEAVRHNGEFEISRYDHM